MEGSEQWDSMMVLIISQHYSIVLRVDHRDTSVEPLNEPINETTLKIKKWCGLEQSVNSVSSEN